MILILSDEDDFSTNQVIDWLLHKKRSFVRINRTTSLDLLNLQMVSGTAQFSLRLEDTYSKKKARLIHSDEISAFWYRRGFLNLAQKTLKQTSGEPEFSAFLKIGINEYLFRENSKVAELLNLLFGKFHHLGSLFDNSTNKFMNSLLAKEMGLLIPNSLITGRKAAFLAFQLKNGPCIAKALDHAGFCIADVCGIGSTYELIETEHIRQMPVSFNLTHFQQFIEKVFDLRIVYLDGYFHSSAILSQSSIHTKTDFRNYDTQKPNRIVPYRLPVSIERKLSQLMNRLKLKTGSIDLIKDQQGRYYFLEVNPIGQYGFVSERCNFNLDFKIADYLSKEPFLHGTAI